MVRNIAFKDVVAEWLEYKRSSIFESTHYGYAGVIKRHIIPALGDVPVRKLTTFMIQNFYNSIGPDHPGSLDGCKKVINQALDYSLIMRYIKKNPRLGVEIRKSVTRTAIRALTTDEAAKLIAAAKPHYLLHAAIVIAYRTGMRRGEICGLMWEDINFNDRFLTVRRSVSCYNGITIRPPKTRTSTRRVDLDTATIDMLHSLRNNYDYVFSQSDGRIYSPVNLTSMMPKLCERAGIRRYRFHDLRHTHASILLAKGIHPKIVQERLGHSDITMTLNTYSHLIPTIQKLAVEVFEEL